MQTKLIIGALVLALIASGWGYSWKLSQDIKVMTAELKGAVERNQQLANDLLLVTESKQELEAKQAEATAAVERLRQDLSKARSRVRTVTIPSDCPGAVEWLRSEFSR